MTATLNVRWLLEELPYQLQKSGASEKVGAIANRLALQIFSVPSLQAQLKDFSVRKDESDSDAVEIQMDFFRLPKEVIPDLERLLSVHEFEDYNLLKYTVNGQAHTGVKLKIKPKKLPGDRYDYAF